MISWVPRTHLAVAPYSPALSQSQKFLLIRAHLLRTAGEQHAAPAEERQGAWVASDRPVGIENGPWLLSEGLG